MFVAGAGAGDGMAASFLAGGPPNVRSWGSPLPGGSVPPGNNPLSTYFPEARRETEPRGLPVWKADPGHSWFSVNSTLCLVSEEHLWLRLNPRTE